MSDYLWKKYNEYDSRTIYFLMNTKDKLVYVGQTKRPKQRYSEHLLGYSDKTKYFMANMKYFEIETLHITEQNAYALELVWIRILRENGFKSINGIADLRNSKRIFENHLPKYEARKDADIYELCNHQKCQM